MRIYKVWIIALAVLAVGGFVWHVNRMPSPSPSVSSEALESKEQVPMTPYQNISADELADMLAQKSFALIDVHIPEQAHIPGTDAFIPFNEIIARKPELPEDKNAKIVLYCRSGSMSRAAAEDLAEQGYTNVYNLAGGLNAWQERGYGVEEISLR